MMPRPPGWTSQWSIASAGRPCGRRKAATRPRSSPAAIAGSSREICMWLSAAVTLKCTCPSVSGT